jgi:hypothetical protein
MEKILVKKAKNSFFFAGESKKLFSEREIIDVLGDIYFEIEDSTDNYAYGCNGGLFDYYNNWVGSYYAVIDERKIKGILSSIDRKGFLVLPPK